MLNKIALQKRLVLIDCRICVKQPAKHSGRENNNEPKLLKYDLFGLLRRHTVSTVQIGFRQNLGVVAGAPTPDSVTGHAYSDPETKLH